ncbi:MAG: type VI secretion system protein TssA [Planctomycetota bacterium]|nr:type VI secretion system protein TssA [Planctomycetota bacterium]
MTVIDVDELLLEVAADAPCGENLEYDADYGELERAAQGKPEQQFGETVIPGEDPDWAAVRRQALALLQRSKDLRIAVTLTRALVRTDGFLGLGASLALIRGYVERYWDSFHPRLDPDDDHDPTLRVNTLCALCNVQSFLLPLQHAPLVNSAKVGRFGLYELAIAKGELPPPPDMATPLEMSTIEAAFMDAGVDQLQQLHAAVAAAGDDLAQIEALVTDRVGVGNAASLSPLTEVLQQAEGVLRAQLARWGISESTSSAAETASQDDPQPGTAASAAPGGPQRLSGDITSRDDVLSALDKLCTYYERYEPSSPVPLLLKRAKRLATKSFLDIIRDLTPDALSQAQAIGGLRDGEESY